MKEQFVKIPTWIAKNPDITPNAKTILLCLTSYNPSFPSYKKISIDTGIKSKTSISKGLKELKSFSILKISKRYNNSNEYEIKSCPFIDTTTKNMDSPTPKNDTYPVQNMESNNINIIKLNNKENDFSEDKTLKSISTILTAEDVSMEMSKILRQLN